MPNLPRIALVVIALLVSLASELYAEDNLPGLLGAAIPPSYVGDVSETVRDVSFSGPNLDAGLSPSSAKKYLSAVQSAPEAKLRGAREARLYSALSPRVVMVLTNDSVGSGALITDSSTVITNWHVIEGFDTVGVIYKPLVEGKEPSAADVRRARVVRFDEVADLALLKIDDPPNHIVAIELGTAREVPVGSDVHAIGHPTGQSWTYTKGFVSQFRENHEWFTESGKQHRADVIQTQTPINPGNSGGPLISDEYRLVGINSFKSQGEGLNFAVSADEVRRFLDRSENRYANSVQGQKTSQEADDCELRWLGEERVTDPDGLKSFVDFDCDGLADGFRFDPDDSEVPIVLVLDTTGDDLADTMFLDVDHDSRIDFSLYDTNADGKPDLRGFHRDGEVEPYRYEDYS